MRSDLGSSVRVAWAAAADEAVETAHVWIVWIIVVVSVNVSPDCVTVPGFSVIWYWD